MLAGGGVSDDELGTLLADYSGSLYLMYGFTETTARAAVRRYGDGSPSGSVGLPLPGTSIDIVSPEGQILPVGEEGLVRACAPSLMIGYLGERPRATGEPFTTTDLGRLDEAGNLFITGRQAEMLNFRGNRVSLVVVEAAAARIEGVLDVRAVPDSREEDAQCVLEVVAAPGIDRAVIKKALLRVVEPRGLIRAVEFVEVLQTTRSGKPLRRS